MMSTKKDSGKMNREIPAEAPAEATAGAEAPIKVNGFAQVLAMLQVADEEFRESLLKRLAQRDPALARSLRNDLTKG
jgi:hypothetical protein